MTPIKALPFTLTFVSSTLLSILLSGCASAEIKSANSQSDSHTTSTIITSNIDIDFTAIAPVKSGKYQAVNCDGIYQLGSSLSASKIADLRFYVTNIQVLTKKGNSLPVTLIPNNYQQSDVALIDLETGSGACDDRGDTLFNRRLKGQLMGNYDKSDLVGISFDLGVPSTKNHTLANSPKTVAPLDIQGMAWSWQAGRKFAKIELKPLDKVTMKDGTQAGIYNLHLGKTGCQGNADRGEKVNCQFNNTAHVELKATDDLANKVVVLNLAEVFSHVNITHDMGKKSGCMSFKGDADCAKLFSVFGLNHLTGNAEGEQQVFRLLSKTP